MTDAANEKSTVLDPKPRPRVAIIGEESRCAIVQGVFPTEQIYSGTARPHFSDFDAAVLLGVGPYGLARTVSFGARQISVTHGPDYTPGLQKILESGPARGQDLTIRSDLDEETRELVKRTLLPKAREQLASSELRGWVLPSHVYSHVVPLLRTSDGLAVGLHGRLAGPGSRQDVWVLPGWVDDPKAWIILAWRNWARSELLPGPPAGFEDPQWMTQAERTSAAALEQIRVKKTAALVALTELETTAQSAFDQSVQLARLGTRRLLTDEGDTLVEAVTSALDLMGFAVTDVDSKRQGLARVEDLRVEHDDWLALAEVKGATKGAATSWFQKVSNHLVTYMSEHGGQRPSAQWLIVNTHRGTAPSARPTPYTNNNAEHLAEFASTGGVVIPTPDLFRLVRDVEAKGISPIAARGLLMNATNGRFEYKPITERGSR